MAEIRAIRLLNSVESGNTNASELEQLLSSGNGRLGEMNVLFGNRAQARRIASSLMTIDTLVRSNTALGALVGSDVLISAVSSSAPARVAVRNAGADKLRRFLTSDYIAPKDFSQWPQEFEWTRRNLPALNNGEVENENATWKAIAHGNGKYVVVGYDSSSVAVSEDGINWDIETLPLTAAWSSVAYGGPNGSELYVAVAENTATYATSPDGINWTARSLPRLDSWVTIFWRNGYFYAIPLGKQDAARSSDGINWAIVANNVVFTDTVTVTGGAEGTPITLNLNGSGTATVPAGVTTLNITGRGGAGGGTDYTGPTGWRYYAHGNGVYVAFHGSNVNDSHYAYSTDGVNWITRPFPVASNWGHVVFANGKFTVATVARSPVGASGPMGLLQSTDGVNWTLISFPHRSNGLIYANGLYISVSDDTVSRSVDGVTWTHTSLTPLIGTDFRQGIAYGNGRFVITGQARSIYSTDGVTWSLGGTYPAGGINAYRNVAFGNGYFVAIRDNQEGQAPAAATEYSHRLIRSTDGVTWNTVRTTTWQSGDVTLNDWSDNIVFANGLFVSWTKDRLDTSNPTTGSSSGTRNQSTLIVTSTDGASWNEITFTNPALTYAGDVNSLVYTDRFRIFGTKPTSGGSGQFINITSTDGVTWTAENFTLNTTASVGATAVVTVLGQAYVYNGSNTTTPPNARTDSITLDGNSSVAFTYNCPVGTLVTATFLATNIEVPLTGSGDVTVPAGTATLSITARGAAGAAAVTRRIPGEPGDPNWDAIAYGNGRFVAIRGSATVTENFAYSADGVNWTKGAMPGGYTGWTDITFGNGKFVAVRTSASNQIFAYSLDGISWSIVTPTALAPAAAGAWRKVTYGAGKFVAVGAGASANVLYSSDGINWASALIPSGLAWHGVVYGNDRFVAVSYDAAAGGANNIAHSLDGISWTVVSIAGDATLRFQSVTYGNSRFLAVGTRTATSTDGVTWTAVGSAINITNVIYAINRFIGFVNESGQILPAHSNDNGVTWTQGSIGNGLNPSGRFTMAAMGGAALVAVATNDAQVASSTDGVNWVTSTPALNGANAVITVLGIQHIFQGGVGATPPVDRTDPVNLDINQATTVSYVVPAGAQAVVSYSGGGTTMVVNTPVTLGSTAAGNAKYVAISYDQELVAVSSDAANWSVVDMPADVRWKSVDYGNGVFTAVAYDTSIAATSVDGEVWTQRSMPTSAKWGGVAYGDDGFVAFTEFNLINATSVNGVSWTQRVMEELPTTNIEEGTYVNVPLNGNSSVTIPQGVATVTITGRGGAGQDEVTQPVYGPDGNNWATGTAPDGVVGNSRLIVHGNGQFVGFSTDGVTGTVHTSTDGAAWTARSAPAFTTLPKAVVYGDGKWVAFSFNGNDDIAVSTDNGLTWAITDTVTGVGTVRSAVYANGLFVAVGTSATNNRISSADADTWSTGSIYATQTNWEQVIYASGKFVAVGSNTNSNHVAYSNDGVNWSTTSIPGGVAGWKSIAYGAGKFVALRNTGGLTANQAATSEDGITWTANVTVANIGNWQALRFANGKFIAVSSNAGTGASNIVLSNNGTSWSTATAAPASAVWSNVIYGNARFLAYGNGTNGVPRTSVDIVTGTEVITPSVQGPSATVNLLSQSLVYPGSNSSSVPAFRADTVSLDTGNQTTVTFSVPAGTSVSMSYVSVGSSTTPVTPLLPISANWISTAFGNGIFVAVAAGSAIAGTSTDGINWTQRTLPVSANWTDVTFANGVFIAVAGNSSIAATSADGINWTQRALPQIETIGTGSATVLDLTGSSTLTIPEGVTTLTITGNGAAGVSSTPAVTLPDNVTARALTMTDVGVLALDWTGYKFARSNNGINWTSGVMTALTSGDVTTELTSTSGSGNSAAGVTTLEIIGRGEGSPALTISNGSIQKVAFGSGKFVTLNSTGVSYQSGDLDDNPWTSVANANLVGMTDIIHAGGRFVAVGNGANKPVGYSTDGVTWTVPTNSSITFNGIAYDGSNYMTISGANGGRLAISSDAQIWSQDLARIHPTNNFSRLAYVNGIRVALSTVAGTTVYYSAQANAQSDWSTATLPISFACTGIAVQNNRFVALGNTADILYSTNGSAWTNVALPAGNTYTSIASYASGFLVFGYQTATPSTKVMYRSTDGGVTWNSVTIPAGNWQNLVDVVNSDAVMLMVGGDYCYSINGGTDWIVGTGVAGASATFTINGQTYTFAGTTGAAPAESTQTVTLNPANSYPYTFVRPPNAALRIRANRTYTSGNFRSAAFLSSSGGAVIRATVGVSENITDKVLYSTNNGTFSYQQVSATPRLWRGVAAGQKSSGEVSCFVMVAANSNVAAYSSNGASWTETTLPSTGDWNAVCWVETGTEEQHRFVAVRTGTAAAYSTDGINWTAATLPSNGTWSTVASRNDMVIALRSGSNQAARSVNGGSTWTAFSMPSTGDWAAIKSNPSGRWVAVRRGSNQGAYSADGTSWVSITLPQSAEWSAVEFNESAPTYKWVATNSSNSIVALSTDGQTWIDGSAPGTTGASASFTINGQQYTFPGSNTSTAPSATAQQVTLNPANSYPSSYSAPAGTFLRISYTPNVTQFQHANWQASAYGSNVIASVAAGTTHAATSPDGTTWTKRELPVANTWQAIAHGNGTFVAIGVGNQAATSSNGGQTWSARTLPYTAPWKDIAYGADKFVAIASGGADTSAVAVSPDGVTWTGGNLPIAADWKSITYKNGLFLVVAANNGTCLTSPDGVVWTQRTLPTSANWSDLTNDGNRFLGISSGGTSAFISFDGITFNRSGPGGGTGLPGSSASSRWNNVTYGRGLYVALAKNSSVVAVSPDGINWTARDLPADTTWSCITYGNGKFVALAENSTNAAYSTDGLTWTPTTLPLAQRWVSVIAGKRFFVAIAKDSNVCLFSKDGIAWTAGSMADSATWVQVSFGNGVFVAVADTGTKVNICSSITTGSITWTSVDVTTNGLTSVTYGNGVFVATCANDSGVDVSTDGIEWTQYGLPSIADWTQVKYGDGVFMAIAYNNAVVATSTDGVEWEQKNLPTAANWKEIAYGKGVFLAISDSRNAVTNC